MRLTVPACQLFYTSLWDLKPRAIAMTHDHPLQWDFFLRAGLYDHAIVSVITTVGKLSLPYLCCR